LVYAGASARDAERELIPHGWRRLAGGVAFCVFSVVACVLVARRLTTASWPLQNAELSFVLLGAGAYLASFGFRRRLAADVSEPWAP
jgi:hypothetical protein